MDPRAVFLQVVFVCGGVLTELSDAGTARVQNTTDVSCSLKLKVPLIKNLLRLSLEDFDRNNGENLGTWTPGFPELEVHINSTLSDPNAQCCLLFMVKGLKEILKDQKEDLNPHDVTLHRHLKESIFRTDNLKTCMKDIVGGECSTALPQPTLPETYFERKQWSHTFIETAAIYISWLEHKIQSLPKKLKMWKNFEA